jgi:hypothetical protein
MRLPAMKILLLVFLLALISISSGCRVRPPLPPGLPVIVPGVIHHDTRHPRALMHRYRYFPTAQVYFDLNRNVYFYFSNNVWLSAPRLPAHIHIDLNNFFTLELEGPKPYVHHSKTIKRYPPGLKKKLKREHREKVRDKREEKKERWEDKKERQKDRLKRKERELDRRENRIERREDRNDRARDRRIDKKERDLNKRQEAKERRKETKEEAKESRRQEKEKKKDRKKRQKEGKEEEEQEEEQRRRGRSYRK